MKVILATPLFPPEIGGPATDAATLAVCLSADGTEAAVLPFSTVRHLPKVIRHVNYFFKLLSVSRGAAAIVAFDTVSVGLPAALAAKLMRIPLVVRVPGDYAWEQSVQRFRVTDSIDVFQHRHYGIRVESLRICQRFVVGTAALVIAPSDYFKHIIQGWGVRPERLTRIYLGLDFIPITRQVTSPPILFSSGRLVPWKGFSLILDLTKALPGWHTVIAGDGPQALELRAKARSLGVADRVEFPGAVSHEEILSQGATAKAFVLNTAFESFSYQLLEVMMMGVPIITTNVGSIPELITNGVEGVLCAPNDQEAFLRALRSVEQEPELWNERTQAAQKKARQFSLQASAEAFASVLQDICG